MPISPRMRITLMVHPQLLCLHSHPLHKQVRCQLIPSPHLYLHPPLGRIKQPRLVPLRTLTRLPSSRADVAEMSATSASHVIAPEGEFDDRMAGGAGLPTFRRCKVLDSLDCDVLGAERYHGPHYGTESRRRCCIVDIPDDHSGRTRGLRWMQGL